MNKLIAVVGASGVGKTALVRAIATVRPFSTAYEEHAERPFQVFFKNDVRYALANQIDYLLLRAEQEGQLRASSQIGLIDGGLDLDFHGLTRLFYSRGLLTGPEFDLCRGVYHFIREFLPRPELIVRLHADEITVADRLATRDRINIASAEDTALFNSFLDEWLADIPADQILQLAATMPLAAPLALWIVYSSNAGDRTAVSQFSLSLMLGLLPTMAFLVTVWLAARSGMNLAPMILTGYGVWAIGALILYLLRNSLGIK